MTQPDGFLPVPAANYVSLAAWAAKTEQDWRDEHFDAEQARWTEVLSGLFGNMPGGNSFIFTLLSELSKSLLGLDPTTFFESLDQIWETLGNWGAQLWEWGVDALAWLTRLITDTLILLDLLHVFYPVGAPGDAPDRTIGGKRTWYSAWNDLQDLFGVVKDAGDPMPALPAADVQAELDDVAYTAEAAGMVADYASGKAVQADGKATTATDWLGQLFEDLTILFDVFHLTYPVGAPSDPPNHTIGGKRTWYAAWNRLWGLHTDAANIPTPPPAPTVADAKAELDAAREATDTLANAVRTGADGSDHTESTVADTAEAVAALRTAVSDVRAALDDLQNEAVNPAGGVRFVASSNGWDSGGGGNWNITGTGTPAFTVNHAYYMVQQSGDRYIYAVYVTPLSSDQHSVTITFNSTPGNPSWFSDSSLYGGSNLAILRANATLTQFVFARIWKNRIQFGYYAGGSRTMVGSKVALGGNVGPGVSVVVRCPNESDPYYFEAVIGGQVVASHTFTAGQAPYGSDYRRIGHGMTIGVGLVGDLFMPGQIQAVSATDMNVGPGFIKGGIGGVMRRYSDATYNQSASFVSTVPEEYFETLEAISPGITRLTGGGADGFVVEDAGLYLAQAGFYIPSGPNYYGATFYSGPFGVGGTIHSFNTYYTQFARGMAVIVANAGDVIKPAAGNGTASIANMTGTADGRNAYFALGRLG
ncbi:minor tail protein [Mycobacterium phage DS6A]|uniref:DUF7257 domain-containing protein n=1 Tax=Mycobacterium phage DS6A TaxID=45764 RepID=G8I4D3_9CAUD|nr:minor tail protein [Mycobacterium phage DS6A]AER47577.1 hypothetical protein DS6A_23 [Mycobacterium phage DS6A]